MKEINIRANITSRNKELVEIGAQVKLQLLFVRGTVGTLPPQHRHTHIHTRHMYTENSPQSLGAARRQSCQPLILLESDT